MLGLCECNPLYLRIVIWELSSFEGLVTVRYILFFGFACSSSEF